MAGQIDTQPEYHTIIRCTPKLEDTVRNDLTKLCGELSAVSLISPENAIELRDSRSGTVIERAAKLVEFVANRVKVNSKDYVLFIQVLTKRYKNIVQELEKVYKELGGKEETDVNTIVNEARPSFTHATSEPSMTSADQPPSHSDVHRSRSTPADLCYSKNMTDDEFKRWLCCKGLTKEQDHCVLLDDGINAKCLACLKEADIEAVAGKLSIGGRAIFGDICKEAMKNVCVLVPKTSHDQKVFTTSASADPEPCASNSSENGNTPQLHQLLDMRHHFKVSQSLRDLPNEDLITLGGALGLNFPKLKKMRDLPSEMVAAWLRKEDNVLECGKPTWRLLATSLKDIGQNGVADRILQNVRT